MSWILSLDILLFPANAPHSWFLSPERPKPCSFCALSPFLPLLTQMHQGQASSAQRYLPFHILPCDLPLSDLCCRIPWVWKPEMFPWLLRLVLARQQEKGVRDQAQSFCLTLDRCWGQCHGKVTSPQAWGLSQWDDTIRHSRSVFLLLQSSNRILGRWKLSFKSRDVARASFSDLWSRPGFPKLQKSYSWPSSLLVICVKWKHCFVRNIVPPTSSPTVSISGSGNRAGCWERDFREEHFTSGTCITLTVTIVPAHMERDPGDVRKRVNQLHINAVPRGAFL